jgi:hypothetical protein
VTWTETVPSTLRLHVLTAVEYEDVLWVPASCSEVEIHRRFRDAYCLYHQGLFSFKPFEAKREKIIYPHTFSLEFDLNWNRDEVFAERQ